MDSAAAGSLAATEGENLPAVDLLLAALKENIAMLPPQTAHYILTQVNTDPTSAIQSNVIEILQRQGNIVSFTVQSR
jgi:hypothetical protein